jgi:hypothetical protein
VLDAQVVVNLLPELCVGVDLVRHDHWLGERFKSLPRNAFSKASAERSNSDGAVSERQQPIQPTPKGRTRLLAVCSTPGRLNHFVALALQQQGQQSALRKGRN